MSSKYVDIIIIGSGMSGLYSAYNIQKYSPDTSFLVLEKHKKQWIGGRASNEMFYGTQVVTGAGIGRKSKDKVLLRLMKELDIRPTDFIFKPHFSELIQPVNINKIIEYLKHKYYHDMVKSSQKTSVTFKEFAQANLGEDVYKRFLITAGYTDYENEDVSQTLNYYDMTDNKCCWTGFYVPWKKMVLKMCDQIGLDRIKTSMDVTSITKINDSPCKFLVETEKGVKFTCNKVIIATTITGIKNLLPEYPIYDQIEGQPFLRLYGKFSKKSIPIMAQFVKDYTIVPGPLQKIIPMDPEKGIYMIAYSDNANAIALKNNLENTKKNRELYCKLLEQSLGIPEGSLQLIAIKDYYWPIGTHYYKPLQRDKFKNRDDFIDKAQHPTNGILVVGEVVSHNQGWTEGALESMKSVLTKTWIKKECF